MATDKSEMFIYWGSGSPPAWRALITLKEKGLDYKDKLLSFSAKEHKSEEVLALNPRGQVPTFKHGDIVINESSAICLYLEDQFKNQGNKLLPDDPAAKGLVLQRFHECGLNIQANVVKELAYYILSSGGNVDQEVLKKKQQTASDEIKLWEGYLQKQGAENHLASKDFSLADACFFPFLAIMVRLGLPIKDKLPALSAYYDMVKERPSVKSTWPPHWQDSNPPGQPFKDLFN